MKKWTAYIKVNSDERSDYFENEVKISNEMYDEIQKCIENNIPLDKSSVMKEFENLAEKTIDYNKCLSWIDEEPDPGDYDDEEEYQEAMEEYNQLTNPDNFSIDYIYMYDPNDRKRAVAKFAGKKYKEFAEKQNLLYQFDCVDNHNFCNYSADIYFEEDGSIKDIDLYSSEGMVYDGLKETEYADCWPDYNFVVNELEKFLDNESNK